MNQSSVLKGHIRNLRRRNKITFLIQWKWAIAVRVGKPGQFLPLPQFPVYLAFKAGKMTWQSIFDIPLFSSSTFYCMALSTCWWQAADLYLLLTYLFWVRLRLLKGLYRRRLLSFFNHLTKTVLGPKNLRKYFLFTFCLANREQCHFFPHLLQFKII